VRVRVCVRLWLCVYVCSVRYVVFSSVTEQVCVRLTLSHTHTHAGSAVEVHAPLLMQLHRKLLCRQHGLFETSLLPY